jgi:hypothetical protein
VKKGKLQTFTAAHALRIVLINGTGTGQSENLYIYILETDNKEISAAKAASLLTEKIVKEDESLASLSILTVSVSTVTSTKHGSTTTNKNRERLLFILAISFGAGLLLLCIIAIVLFACLCRKVQVANQFDLENQYARYKQDILID